MGFTKIVSEQRHLLLMNLFLPTWKFHHWTHVGVSPHWIFFDFESSYHLMNFLEKFKNAVAFGGCIDSSIPPNSNDIVHPVLLNDTPNQKIINKSLVVDTYGLLCGLKA